MLPNHFRTNDEINGVDTTAYSVQWIETKGKGELIVRHSVGEIVGRVAHEEPISASTNSWAVASKVATELGMTGPAWVDHDGEFIHFGQN